MATGRPLTISNAPLATFAGRAHRCTAGRMSRAGLGVRPIGLTLGRCRSWPLSSCSQGGGCSLAARASSVAKQQAARTWRISRRAPVRELWRAVRVGSRRRGWKATGRPGLQYGDGLRAPVLKHSKLVRGQFSVIIDQLPSSPIFVGNNTMAMDQEPACTAASALVFLIALTAGTGCTVAAKSIFGLSGVGITGEVEPFRPPLFLTLMMFFGMAFALPAHFLKQAYRRRLARTDRDEAAKLAAEPAVTAKTYILLAVPALFDLLATALMTAGLLSVDASVWQLLRGSAIILVAVMKHFVLLDLLTRAQVRVRVRVRVWVRGRVQLTLGLA